VAPVNRQGYFPVDQRWPEVELVRFMAAVIVMLAHGIPHLQAAGVDTVWFTYTVAAAVQVPDMFFVLSGAVLSYSVERRNEQYKQVPGAVRFLMQRLARIFLAYWPFLLLMFIANWIWLPSRIPQKNWLLSFFLWPQEIHQVVLPVTWTLSHLLVCYLIFSLLLAIKKWSLPSKILSAALSIILLNAYAIFILQIYDPNHLMQSSWWWRVGFSPYFIEFATGCGLMYWARSHALGARRYWISSAILLNVAAAWINLHCFDGRLTSGYATPQRIVILLPVATAMVMAVLACAQKQRSSHPLWSMMGKGSYSLYLLHPIVLFGLYASGLRDTIAAMVSAGFSYAGLTIGLLMSITAVFAVMYGHYIERPAYQWVKHRWLTA
jgi:peptidoglycan/LPS O-acetylase OafA/YrhL